MVQVHGTTVHIQVCNLHDQEHGMGWLPLYLKRRDSKAAVGGSSVFFSFGKKDALPIGCTRKRRSIIATSTLKPFYPREWQWQPRPVRKAYAVPFPGGLRAKVLNAGHVNTRKSTIRFGSTLASYCSMTRLLTSRTRLRCATQRKPYKNRSHRELS